MLDLLTPSWYFLSGMSQLLIEWDMALFVNQRKCLTAFMRTKWCCQVKRSGEHRVPSPAQSLSLYWMAGTSWTGTSHLLCSPNWFLPLVLQGSYPYPGHHTLLAIKYFSDLCVMWLVSSFTYNGTPTVPKHSFSWFLHAPRSRVSSVLTAVPSWVPLYILVFWRGVP